MLRNIPTEGIKKKENKKNKNSTSLACRKSKLQEQVTKYKLNKNLCGRDGRTICGPQCVPKSTSVTLTVDEKTLPMATIKGRTDRQTDRRTDGQTECDAICDPLPA